MVAFVDN
jgi:hypothetical protein